MTKQHLRIGFIGAGSIGSLFGGYLANVQSDIYSIEVIFFNIDPYIDIINRKGLKIYKDQDTILVKNIVAYENEKFLKDKIKNNPSFKFDYMFLTTKTYDNEKALIQYKDLINVSNYLVILQNGIGNEDLAIKYYDRTKIIRAVTSNGALLSKPGHLYHTGKGITKIGFPYHIDTNSSSEEYIKSESNLKLLKDILNLAGFQTIIVHDIIMESWEKVFVNIGINALGALTRLPNGALLKNDKLKYLLEQAIREAIEVAKEKGIKLPEKDYFSIAYNVAENTADNKNSMLQDILNKKTTEIDFINGRILKYALKLGMKVPVNEMLTYLIKGLENSQI
ncbi:MAG: ketopantoate reductase family protein [Promethearchaeota archaeon]